MPAERARKLAAIVSIDIAGFSAMSERDSAAAAAIVRETAEVIDRTVRHYRGRVFNTAGDGFMAEFTTARDAMACAILILRRLRTTTAVRIGAHLGEVTVLDNDDLLGHGVNVAARLRALAMPRGLVASDAMVSPLSARLKRLFIGKGPILLEKMNASVPVYALSGNLGPVGRLRLMVRRPWRAAMAAGALAVVALGGWAIAAREPSDPLIAVMAFDAPDGEKAERIAIGLADEIIMDLAQTPDVRVAARASSFGVSAESDSEAARKLGARYIVDGVVRMDGDKLRVDAHLVDTRRRDVVWAKRFERDVASTFALQSEIAGEVVTGATGRVRDASPRAAADVPPDILDLYLQGRAARLTRNPEEVEEAIGLLQRAVARAPTFAKAWSELAGAQLIRADQIRLDETPDHRAAVGLARAARASAERALELEPRDAYALAVLAGLQTPGDWRAQRRLLDRAVEIAPGDAVVLRARARLLSDMGYLALARADLERARALDPLDPQILLIWTMEAQGDAARARGLLARSAETAPNTTWNTRLLFHIFDRRYADALALLDIGARPASVGEPAVERYRLLINALRGRRGGDPVAAWRALARERPARAEDSIFALALMGRNDLAFTIGQETRAFTPAGMETKLSPDAAYEGPLALFRADLAAAPALAPLRRDRRYLELMKTSGLYTAWRDSGEWPDFCTDASLTYRCDAP
jgi:adenylate cyclase